MQTVPIEQKLVIIIKIAFLLKETINQIIDPIFQKESHTNSYILNSSILKELQSLPIKEFIELSKKALSKFNASTCENSLLSIRVKRIIEEFTEIKILINSSSSIPKRTFFSSPAPKINLNILQKNLTAINEIFNMLSEETSNLVTEQYIRSVPGA